MNVTCFGSESDQDASLKLFVADCMKVFAIFHSSFVVMMFEVVSLPNAQCCDVSSRNISTSIRSFNQYVNYVFCFSALWSIPF